MKATLRKFKWATAEPIVKKIVGIVKLIKVMRANRVAWSNFPFRKAKFRMKLFSKTNER